MQNPLTPPRRKLTHLASIAALAVLLLGLFSSTLQGGIPPVHAQDPTAYPGWDATPTPYPTFGGDYPVETQPPPSGGITPSPTLENTPLPGTTTVPQDTPTLQTPLNTPRPTLTLTITQTLPPNAFQTENAEMGSGNVTPPPSETPGPTMTVYASETPTLGTEQPTRMAAVRKKNTSPVDWGLFWIGFSIPVLSACGLVLYLLDQRPDFLRLRKK